MAAIAAIFLASIALAISGIQFTTSHRPFINFNSPDFTDSGLSQMRLPYRNSGSTTAIIISARLRRNGGPWTPFNPTTKSCEPSGTFSCLFDVSDNPYGSDGKQAIQIDYRIEYQGPFAFSFGRFRYGIYVLDDSWFVYDSDSAVPKLKRG